MPVPTGVLMISNVPQLVTCGIDTHFASGVPDRDHPWVSTRPEMFEAYMHYLKEQGYEVLSLRQLGSLVDTNRLPADAWEIIEQRKAARKEAYVKALVEDADTGEPLAVRVYIEGEDGTLLSKVSRFTG